MRFNYLFVLQFYTILCSWYEKLPLLQSRNLIWNGRYFVTSKTILFPLIIFNGQISRINGRVLDLARDLLISETSNSYHIQDTSQKIWRKLVYSQISRGASSGWWASTSNSKTILSATIINPWAIFLFYISRFFLLQKISVIPIWQVILVIFELDLKN